MPIKDISPLLRDNIRAIKPYTSARDEFSGTAEVYLDANENSYGSADASGNERYPDPYQLKIKQRISEIKGVPAENIFVGNGSDEAIDLLIKAFCRPGQDGIIIAPPTYGMYQVQAEINDAPIIEVPLLPGYQLDVPGIMAQASKAKIVFLCSPNNPTGNLLKTEDIAYLLEHFPGIVAVDEAYIDFADIESWNRKIGQYPGLVVLQTLSKAWGLANLRLGLAFAAQPTIQILSRIKLPYNISGLVQEHVLQALAHVLDKEEKVAEILAQRAYLEQNLPLISGVNKLYPSDANFILAKIDRADELYRALVEKGIVVRNRSKLKLCEGCLRITVGTEAENKALLSAISAFFQA